GRAALGEEQQRETGGDGLDVVVRAFGEVAVPVAVGLLRLDQPAAADLVPVVPAQVALAADPARSFDAIQAVERRRRTLSCIKRKRLNERLLGVARRVALADPRQGVGDGLVLLVLAALLAAAILAQDRLTFGQIHAGDEQVA